MKKEDYYTLSRESTCLDSKHCFDEAKRKIPKSALKLTYIDPYNNPIEKPFILVMTRIGQFYADCVTGTLYHTETGVCQSGNFQRLALNTSQILPFVAPRAGKLLKAIQAVTDQPVMEDKTGSVIPVLRRSKYVKQGAAYE